jgi:hypothetical protein
MDLSTGINLSLETRREITNKNKASVQKAAE